MRDAAARLIEAKEKGTHNDWIKNLTANHDANVETMIPCGKQPSPVLLRDSDWADFKQVAQQTGHVLLSGSGTIHIQKPRVADEAQLTVSFGTDVIDLSLTTSDAIDKLGTIRRGTIQFLGSAVAEPNSVIELVGIGRRMSGDAYVSDVQHHLQDGSWGTTAEIGFSTETND